MTKKVDTWMPLLVDKYLGDTTHLTTELHGAYLLLLLAMWKMDGVLPNDDLQLQPITRLPPARWRAAKPLLLSFFRPTEDGKGLTQKRLMAELKRSKASTEKKSEAGAKGAEARWQKDGGANGKPDGKDDGTGIADGWQEACETGASTPTPDATHLSASTDVLAPHRTDGPQLALIESQKPKPKGPPDCPHLAVLALWEEVLPELPQHQPAQWKGSRADHLRARWRESAVAKGWETQEEGLQWMRKLFAYVAQSPFLTGRVASKDPSRGPFMVRLAWLVEPGNWAKVVEGEYHSRNAA